MTLSFEEHKSNAQLAELEMALPKTMTQEEALKLSYNAVAKHYDERAFMTIAKIAAGTTSKLPHEFLAQAQRFSQLWLGELFAQIKLPEIIHAVVAPDSHGWLAERGVYTAGSYLIIDNCPTTWRALIADVRKIEKILTDLGASADAVRFENSIAIIDWIA